MPVFDEIAAAVNRAWKPTSYDNRALPEIATAVLAESRLAERVTLDDVAAWFFEAETIPNQPNLNSEFGQPPVTVYADQRLYIEVLTWLENTTSIHQHGFSGAFYVLGGSSLHTVYDFDEHDRVNNRLLFGELTPTKVERLEVGDLHPIHAGGAYIHGLFHLGYPSVTVVVRTFVEPDQTPQYKFMRPSVAVDDFHSDPVFKRQRQYFETLHKIGAPALDGHLDAWFARADFESAFRMLTRLYFRGVLGGERIERILGAVEAKHGDIARHIRPVLVEESRTRNLMAMRPHITDAAHRLLLALMIAAPGRERAWEVIEKAYPGEPPARRIFQWIAEINAASPTPLSFADVQSLVGMPTPAAA